MSTTTRTADAMAVGSAGAYVAATWLVKVTPLLQDLALLAAIFSGVVAGLFHLTKLILIIIDRVRGRKDAEE